MNSIGIPIISLGQRSAEYPHLPLQWMPQTQVTDVTASVRPRGGILDGTGRDAQ